FRRASMDTTLPSAPLSDRKGVDESDRLSFCKGLCIGSFNQNSRSVPNVLRPDLHVLWRRTIVSSVMLAVTGLTSLCSKSFDPHQFVYRATRPTEDACRTVPSRTAGGAMCDWSAFNTIIPHRLSD
ncbi:hypothetical protein GOODEAATRI_007197, partial [Goodea atripinnis]